MKSNKAAEKEVSLLISKKKNEQEIKIQMKKLGTYKPQYNTIISIFAGILTQYEEFERQFAESGYQITEEYTNKAGAVNERKVPIYTALESLRKDIITYSDRLCLNPKSLETVTTQAKNSSVLAAALREMK